MFKKSIVNLLVFSLIVIAVAFVLDQWVHKESALKKTGPRRIALSVSTRGTYEIVKRTFTSKGVKIAYPQVAQLKDSGKQRFINKRLKKEALKVRDFYGKIADLEYTLDVDYQIALKSANLLSVRYSGLGYVKNAAYPNHLFFSTTIRIPKGSKLRLKELITIDDRVFQKFQEGKWKAVNPQQSEALNSLTRDEFIRKLKRADASDALETSGTFSYLTKDSLGIGFSVAHALGDHVEFEIKYPDIKEILKIKKDIL